MIDSRNENGGQMTRRKIGKHIPEPRRHTSTTRGTCIGAHRGQVGYGPAPISAAWIRSRRRLHVAGKSGGHKLRLRLAGAEVDVPRGPHRIHVLWKNPSSQVQDATVRHPPRFYFGHLRLATQHGPQRGGRDGKQVASEQRRRLDQDLPALGGTSGSHVEESVASGPQTLPDRDARIGKVRQSARRDVTRQKIGENVGHSCRRDGACVGEEGQICGARLELPKPASAPRALLDCRAFTRRVE